MKRQQHTHRANQQDTDRWLQTLTLEDARRLAVMCEVGFGQDENRHDIVDRLGMERKEDKRIDDLLCRLESPATKFDVTNVKRSGHELVNSELSQIKGELKCLEAEANRNTSLRTVFGIITGAVSFMLVIAAIAGLDIRSSFKEMDRVKGEMQQTKGDMNDSIKTVEATLADGEKELALTRQYAREAKQDLTMIILSLSDYTSREMLWKLIVTLDRLRYHQMSRIAKGLAQDLDAGAETINRLKTVLEAREDAEQEVIQRLRLLGRIHDAIVELNRVYVGDRPGNLDEAEHVRDLWKQLGLEIVVFRNQYLTDSSAISEDRLYAKNLNKLRAIVHHIEAGLAIAEYRGMPQFRSDFSTQQYRDRREYLLRAARVTCTEAIATDDSVTMPYVWMGLSYSLEMSQQREDKKPIEVIEDTLQRGEKWYRDAISKSSSPELKATAHNNLAYLFVKLADTVIESENGVGGQQREKIQQLLNEAEKQIKKAMNVAQVVDPIIFTTQADIKILQLALKTEAELAHNREESYEDILETLRRAVENGYTGYSPPRALFFEKRPHFRHLSMLNENYQQDVCAVVRIDGDDSH